MSAVLGSACFGGRLRGLEFRVSGIGSYPKPESTLELRLYGSFPK